MTEYFKNIPKINYEGPESDNPLSFKYYQDDKVVLGKSMKEHLRFATCYWHTFTWQGLDPFGGPTFDRPWMQKGDLMDLAVKKLLAPDVKRDPKGRQVRFGLNGYILIYNTKKDSFTKFRSESMITDLALKDDNKMMVLNSFIFCRLFHLYNDIDKRISSFVLISLFIVEI